MADNEVQKTETTPAKKAIVVNKYLKNFFFMAFKSTPPYKALEKEIGQIDTVTVIISTGKNILRAQSEDKTEDTPFTEEEMKKFLKTLNVKEETVKQCKSIFVMLDMKNQKVFIQQNRIDGTKKEFDL